MCCENICDDLKANGLQRCVTLDETVQEESKVLLRKVL